MLEGFLKSDLEAGCPLHSHSVGCTQAHRYSRLHGPAGVPGLSSQEEDPAFEHLTVSARGHVSVIILTHSKSSVTITLFPLSLLSSLLFFLFPSSIPLYRKCLMSEMTIDYMITILQLTLKV